MWASPPCQAWSIASHNSTNEDVRGAEAENNGWPWVLDAIDDTAVIREKKDAIDQQRRDRGNDTQVMVDDLEGHKVDYHAKLDAMAAEVGLTATGEQRVSGQLKDAMVAATNEYRVYLDAAKNNHAEVIDKLDQLKKEEQSAAVYNLVRDDIFTKLYDPNRVDALGRFDFEGYKADEDSIRSDYAKYTDAQGNSIVDSVFANLRNEEHQLQTRWREAKVVIEPWFNVPDDVAQQVLNITAISAEDKALLRAYIKPGALVTSGSDLDIIKLYNEVVDEMRAVLRDEAVSPEAVALNQELVAWDLASLSLSTMRLGNIQGFIQNLDPKALQELIASVTP